MDALTGKRRWLFETFQEVPNISKYRSSKRKPSDPVAAGGLIVVIAWPVILEDTPEKSHVYAVSPESGKAKWVTTLDGGNLTVPVAANGLVFVAIEDPGSPPRPGHPLGTREHGTMYAINAVDGQIKWKLRADLMSGGLRLLIAGSTIYFQTDQSLIAADLETGRPRWSFSADDIRAGTGVDDKHLYVITHEGTMAWPDDTLHALALTTGQEKWSRGLSGNAHVAMVDDGVVYAGVGPLRSFDAATGEELWSFMGTGRESARLISGGTMFLSSSTVTYIGSSRVDQGYLYAIDLKTDELAR